MGLIEKIEVNIENISIEDFILSKKYIIIVVDCGILSSNDDCIGDIDEVYTEEEEYCSEVATYLITLSGESEGSCRRDLTYEQYKLIKGIFEDCESEYVSGTITKE